MRGACFFYLLLFFWGGSVVYHFVHLSRQRGTAWAVACLYRLLHYNYGPEARYDQQLLPLVLLLKAGAYFGLALLMRLFWVTRWTEAVFILVILAAAVGAFSFLISFRKNNPAIQCVYPLSEEYGVYEIFLAPSGAVQAWIGMTLAELDLRRKELLVLSIVRGGKVVIFPKGPEVLLAGDRLLVFGKTATLPEGSLPGED